MKRRISIFLTILALCILTACEDTKNTVSGRTGNQMTGVNDILQKRMEDNNRSLPEMQEPLPPPVTTDMPEAGETPASEPAETPEYGEMSASEPAGVQDAANESPAVVYDHPDVDLTQLSGTMVYAEVNQMMVSPESYIGKTVRMSGAFDYFHDESAGRYYLACIVQDATACCAQGIEFVPAGDFRYPDDFPEVGETICVAGVFDTYTEGEYRYCTLRNATLEKDV